ncbi:unnamed protein product [Clonostachys chloroleuca]|uniref:Zn(2)-C6 fungal-type domain-containing protein n=1 Tax=Clonostachys chloroleuca TaxID=1926264 RepID=A0AA35M7I5_9HYPO|nr:unnamed protein product [Clonostachys chloroleuca]
MSTTRSKLKSRSCQINETVPNCLNCLRGGATCPGYRTSVKWSGKHEVLRSRDQRPAAGDSMEPFWNVFEKEASRLHAVLMAEAASPRQETVSSSPGSIVSEPVGTISSQEHSLLGIGLSEITAASEILLDDDNVGWSGWVSEQSGAEFPITTSQGYIPNSIDYTQSFDIYIRICGLTLEHELIHEANPPCHSLSPINSREDDLVHY